MVSSWESVRAPNRMYLTNVSAGRNPPALRASPFYQRETEEFYTPL